VGTEIVGVIIFVLVALAISVVLGITVKNIPASVAMSTLIVVTSVQALNYFYIGQCQLMSAQQFAYTGGLPAIITLVVALAAKIRRA
jgi:zinc transporter ZupT